MLCFCIFAKIMIVLTSMIFAERPFENLNWVIIVLVITMLILVISKAVFSNNFYAIGSLERFVEVNDNQQIFSLINQFLFAVLLGTLCVPYLIEDYDYIFYLPIVKAVSLAVILLLFFWAKSLFAALGAYAFKLSYNNTVNFRVASYYRFYSVAVLWLAVLLFYFSDVSRLIIFLICLIILVLLRVLNFTYRIKNQQEQISKNWYYNILYLCALEILPLLVLYKFLTVW